MNNNGRVKNGEVKKFDTQDEVLVSGESYIVYKTQQIVRSNKILTGLSQMLSVFGEHALGWVLFGGIGVIIGARDKKRLWVNLVIQSLLSHVGSTFVKYLVRRPRPSNMMIDSAHTAGKYSFPSSHTSAATSAALSLSKITHMPIPICIGTLAVPMTVSRLEQGVHYPSDLIAGVLFGGVFYWLTSKIV